MNPHGSSGSSADPIMLADRSWTEIDPVAARCELMLCLGAMEQHGPHLPLDTDTVIIADLARRWAESRPGRLVGPIIPLGASGEHADFAGTLSIGTEAAADLIVETVRSGGAFRRMVVAAWHGGNADAMSIARSRLLAEQRPVSFWMPTAAGDAHAGRTETSMMLAIDPERVRLDRLAPGNTRPLSALMPALRATGVRNASPNGVLGDPAGADPEEGEAILRGMIAEYERSAAVRAANPPDPRR